MIHFSFSSLLLSRWACDSFSSPGAAMAVVSLFLIGMAVAVAETDTRRRNTFTPVHQSGKRNARSIQLFRNLATHLWMAFPPDITWGTIRD